MEHLKNIYPSVILSIMTYGVKHVANTKKNKMEKFRAIVAFLNQFILIKYIFKFVIRSNKSSTPLTKINFLYLI